jgi:hypothetical protein
MLLLAKKKKKALPSLTLTIDLARLIDWFVWFAISSPSPFTILLSFLLGLRHEKQ